MLSNNTDAFMSDVCNLIDSGTEVILPVKGNSMVPFIIGGKDSVVLKKHHSLSVGDIVLAWADNQYYVIHRIIHLYGNDITLMGDGNVAVKEHCTKKDIMGKVLYVTDGQGAGKRHYVYSTWRKITVRLWMAFLPIRKYLLYIYRKL